MWDTIRDISETLEEPYLGFRFSVFFYNFNHYEAAKSITAAILDSRFQKVSGLSAEIDTEAIEEGGQNLYKQKVPVSINYGNLVLERGIVVGPSLLNSRFEKALSSFKFDTFNVLVILHNVLLMPIAAWNFLDAYPVKMSTSDLDAKEPGLLIDTLELAYSQMKTVTIGGAAQNKVFG